MENTSAEDSLLMIANDTEIIQAIKDALALYDGVTVHPGPSRTQTIRTVLVLTLDKK